MSELPQGWIKVALPEVVFFQEGPGLRKFQYRDSGIPFLNIRTFVDEKIDKELCRYLGKDEVYAKYQHFLVNENDILVGISGSIGKIAIARKQDLPLMLNTSIMRFRPLSEKILNWRYLYWFLKSSEFIGQAWEASTGSAQSNVGPTHIQQFSIKLPPVNEQKRIAAKLDSLFARTRRAREELERVPRLVEHYKQEVLRKAFEGELTVNWRVTNAHVEMSDDVSRIDNRVGERPFLPSGWAWSSLDRIAQVSGGLTKNAKRRQIGNHVPYLRVANVYANELRLDDVQEIGCTEAELHKTRLEKDDLLIVEGNGSLEHIGRVALWNGSIDPCSHQNHLIRVRVPSAEQSKYLLYWLLSPLGRQFIERVASSSSGLYTLSISKVSGLPVPVCSLQEMAAVVKQIEKSWFWLDGFIEDCGNAIRLLDQLDSSILAKAFRGELVSQHQDDEPAAVLLARIQEASTSNSKPTQ